MQAFKEAYDFVLSILLREGGLNLSANRKNGLSMSIIAGWPAFICLGCGHALVSYSQLNRLLWYIDFFRGQIYWLYSDIVVSKFTGSLSLSWFYHWVFGCFLGQRYWLFRGVTQFSALDLSLSLHWFCHWDSEILTIKYHGRNLCCSWALPWWSILSR